MLMKKKEERGKQRRGKKAQIYSSIGLHKPEEEGHEKKSHKA